MKRRLLIQAAAALPTLPLGAAAAERQRSTAAQQTGPYYPLDPIPLRDNLLLASDYTGQQLALSGQVLNLARAPLAGIRVEIWQCDSRGIYPHPKAPNHQRFDTAFAGHGALLTDPQGNYRFRTIMPVPYTGRPPHIHARIKMQQKTLLTTQIYLTGSTAPDSLKIAPQSSDQLSFEARFNFIVEV